MRQRAPPAELAVTAPHHGALGFSRGFSLRYLVSSVQLYESLIAVLDLLLPLRALLSLLGAREHTFSFFQLLLHVLDSVGVLLAVRFLDGSNAFFVWLTQFAQF